MGKASKALDAFIDDIPVASLENLPTTAGTIHKDTNFRLDMQGMTTKDPKKPEDDQKHNLQIQANKETDISTLKKVAPKTVAGPVLVSSKEPETADAIKTKFKEAMLI